MNRVTRWVGASAFASGLLLAAGAAQATVFDFGTIAVGNEGGNPSENDAAPIGLRFDGTNNVFTDGFTGSGLQLIATGQNISGSGNNPVAYLDDLFQGRKAGLGVCQQLESNEPECTPSSDDNVTGADSTVEQLTLTSNFAVTLSGLLFRDELHHGIGAANTLLLNGNDTTFADAQNAVLMGDTFTFAYGGSNPTQFYLNAASADPNDVPAPAAIGVLAFALGLIGVGVGFRRRAEAI